MEIIVGGKNKGDRYRIKNNYVSMVLRKIHGRFVQIYTEEIKQTTEGYLSLAYSSQYSDPSTGEITSPKCHFNDTFQRINEQGPWVLSQRIIETEDFAGSEAAIQRFSFIDLKKHY